MTINNIPLKGFTIYSLEMKMSFFERYVPTYSQKALGRTGELRDFTLFSGQIKRPRFRELK